MFCLHLTCGNYLPTGSENNWLDAMTLCLNIIFVRYCQEISYTYKWINIYGVYTLITNLMH